MKKVSILIFVMAFITMSFTNSIQLAKRVLKVDIANSTIHWKGYKPTGSHHGTIQLISGELNVKGATIIGGSFTANMQTIKDAGGSAKLERHLKSEDFFGAEAFDTSTFHITSTKVKEGKTIVIGDMTIKGVTKQITFPATVTETQKTVTLTSEIFKINRADFNVKYKSKSFFGNLKDRFIHDEFELKVEIVAFK